MAGRTDDNKISEKNIKPEILMDLSRVSEEMDEPPRPLDDHLARPKRKLSRVSSDSACRATVAQEHRQSEVKFHIGPAYSDEEPPSLRHSRTDLTVDDFIGDFKSDTCTVIRDVTSDSRVGQVPVDERVERRKR